MPNDYLVYFFSVCGCWNLGEYLHAGWCRYVINSQLYTSTRLAESKRSQFQDGQISLTNLIFKYL